MPDLGSAARPSVRSRKETRIRQAEELRKKSIASLYKQLAKVLHPDLEPNAQRRARKAELMQELTTAYRTNDLHTLLRLELEWIEHEEGDLASLTDEKLSVYNQVLREQSRELERELADLAYHPRYQPITARDGRLTIRPRTEGPAEAHLIDTAIASVEESIARLRSSKANAEVRAAIREYRDAGGAAW